MGIRKWQLYRKQFFIQLRLRKKRSHISQYPHTRIKRIKPHLLGMMIIPGKSQAIHRRNLPVNLLDLLPHPFRVRFHLSRIGLIQTICIGNKETMECLFIVTGRLHLHPPVNIVTEIIQAPSQIKPDIDPCQQLHFPAHNESPAFLLPAFKKRINNHP